MEQNLFTELRPLYVTSREFSAETAPGRILSVILGLYGIIVVAVITSVVVNFYNEMKSVDDDDG